VDKNDAGPVSVSVMNKPDGQRTRNCVVSAHVGFSVMVLHRCRAPLSTLFARIELNKLSVGVELHSPRSSRSTRAQVSFRR
jgi:hypothetical protein